ncbi:hypothetical protein TNCV_3623021 [Trichonephila clavipes]|nr:hypothetical protein TNCV_3623021 [Trichonephila clavipes]
MYDDMLELIENVPYLLVSAVTCDATWTFTYDIEKKEQPGKGDRSLTPHSPAPQKYFTFTHIDVFSEIRTQALQHCSQCRKSLYRECG